MFPRLTSDAIILISTTFLLLIYSILLVAEGNGPETPAAKSSPTPTQNDSSSSQSNSSPKSMPKPASPIQMIHFGLHSLIGLPWVCFLAF
jgi:hypothetical protein